MPCKLTPNFLRSISTCLALLIALGGMATTLAQAQTFTILHSFLPGPHDGREPYGSLVFDTQGNLYGTTNAGGADSEDYGTVFKLSPNGRETILHSFFFSVGGFDGQEPLAGLVRDVAGNLYGTTGFGGTNNAGTIFKIDAAGTETILHDFTPGNGDGAYPFYGALTMDPAGSLYGTTLEGGPFNSGTVFKLDANGVETVLYSFTGAIDGAFPAGSLVMDSTGNLYGTTQNGGTTRNCSQCGVVFRLSPTTSGSWQETVLHNFGGDTGRTPDGKYPLGGLVLNASGRLFGTTRNGGPADCGTVFEVGTSGQEKVLYDFGGPGTGDGCTPIGILLPIQGNLYGTTAGGGGAGGGIIFEIGHNGIETVLHNFDPSSDGSGSVAGLVRGPDGGLYGTTTSAGPNNGGTVFKLIP